MSDRDDGQNPLVSLSFLPLTLLTAVFGPMLFFFPDRTEDYWSWAVRPAMSAVWIGAAYTSGAVALSLMLYARSWRATFIPVVSTLAFAVVMLGATLAFNDRFFVGTFRYFGWLAIYILLPIVLPSMLWTNRHRDPGSVPGELLLSLRTRTVLVIAGTLVGALGLCLVFGVRSAVEAWPWPLTPLMATVVGAWLLFLAIGGLSASFEARYCAFRFYLPAAVLWFALILGGSMLHLGDFESGPATPIFLASVATACLGLVLLVLRMEVRHGKASGSMSPSPRDGHVPVTPP